MCLCLKYIIFDIYFQLALFIKNDIWTQNHHSTYEEVISARTVKPMKWSRGILTNQCAHAIKVSEEQIVAWMTLGEPIQINREYCLPVSVQ